MKEGVCRWLSLLSVQVFNEYSGRFTPPAKITALFDDKTVYYSFGEDSGDPFEDEINLIHAIPVSEEMLRGFGSFGVTPA